MIARRAGAWSLTLGSAFLTAYSSPSSPEASVESRVGESIAPGADDDPACRFSCPHEGTVDAYAWHGQIVYLVRPGCCDQFDTVYTADCKQVCAPSGGFTGKGDGKCPGFYDEASHRCAVEH